MLFDKDMLDKIAAIDQAPEGTTYVELAAIAGLDPARDFQHSDCVEVDFSNCDLRGWNFTGADMRRSTGTNVIWDETTILTDANIEGSIFEKGRNDA